MPVAMVAAAVASVVAGRAARAMGMAVALLLAGYYGVFVTTAVDPVLLVSTTADRLLVQIWPTLVLAARTIGEPTPG